MRAASWMLPCACLHRARPPAQRAGWQVQMDNINLFSLITILSLFLLAPFTLLREGVQFTPSAMRALGVANTEALMRKALLAGFCFHAYQQVGPHPWGAVHPRDMTMEAGSALAQAALAASAWPASRVRARRRCRT